MTDKTQPVEDVEDIEEQDTATSEADGVDDAPPAPPADDEPDTSEEDNDLTAALQEARKNLEGWQRARAEFANYKKRVERERVDVRENAVLDVVKALLPTIDDFERSIENVPEDLEDNAWVDGTIAIGRKLQRILEQYDIEPIDPVGQPFDPDYHQGLGIDEESDLESGHVSETLQRGYKKGDKVLRPALVRVAG